MITDGKLISLLLGKMLYCIAFQVLKSLDAGYFVFFKIIIHKISYDASNN